jgi:hypothetical protein
VRFPPITNATLTRVQPGGGAEDYDATTLSGADKFTGSQAAFVSDEQVSRDTGGTSTVVLERSVVVDDALAVDWARGDTLTYTYRGEHAHRRGAGHQDHHRPRFPRRDPAGPA